MTDALVLMTWVWVPVLALLTVLMALLTLTKHDVLHDLRMKGYEYGISKEKRLQAIQEAADCEHIFDYALKIYLACLIVFPSVAFMCYWPARPEIQRRHAEAERKENERNQEIYNQGMDAAENGIPDSACPYQKYGGKYASESPDARKWLEGWIAKKTQMNKEQKQ